MKKTLITGAAGFIGFHAARRELKKGNFVIGIDNLDNQLSELSELSPPPTQLMKPKQTQNTGRSDRGFCSGLI